MMLESAVHIGYLRPPWTPLKWLACFRPFYLTSPCIGAGHFTLSERWSQCVIFYTAVYFPVKRFSVFS